MNKVVTVLVIIVISLSVACGILFYQIVDMQTQNSDLQNQTSQLENQVNELELQNLEQQENISELEEQLNLLTNGSLLVRITNCQIAGWDNFVATTIWSTASVTIQNFGTNDVEGLKLSLYPVKYGGNTSVQLEPLLSGEKRTVIAEAIWELGAGKKFTITLTLDDIILDKYYYP